MLQTQTEIFKGKKLKFRTQEHEFFRVTAQFRQQDMLFSCLRYHRQSQLNLLQKLD